MFGVSVGIMDAGAAGGAAGSYESIATAVGTGSSGTITFNSIPSTYKHLQIRYRARTSAAGESILMTVNSDTGSNYTRHRLGGEGSFVFAAGQASMTAFYVGDTRTGTDTTFFEVNIIDIIDYASTTKNKTERHFQGMDRNGSGSLTLASGLWMNTSAINTLSIYVTAGNFTNDSVFSLYGIKG